MCFPILTLWEPSRRQKLKIDLVCSGPKLSIQCDTAAPQIEHLIKKMKQEEAKRKNFNIVLLIFWGCLNNYLADVVSMAAITLGRRARHYQWGQQSVLCLRWGDNTLTPNSVNQPSGFLSNGKAHISKAQCSACLSLCATLGSQAAHWKQTLGQTELFIQLYTLFGGCMSLSDWETICCVSWRITDFELCSSVPGGVYFQFLQATGFFLRSTQRQDTPIKLLIIPLWQLSHSWTSSWPSKWKNYFEFNYPRCEHNYFLFLPPFSSTVCCKGRRLSPASSNITPLNVYFLKERYYWNTCGNSGALHLHWLGFEPWNWGLWTTTILV